METLLKIETTSIKIQEMERVREMEDRLASNKMALSSTSTQVKAGPDNRWTVLHPARFLPGMACTAAKLWFPSSSKLSVKMFSINNCTAKIGRSSMAENSDNTGDDLMDLGNFKLALRTLRTTASFVKPWNYSFLAIEGFMMQSQYCRADLAGLEKKATLLTQFVEYCIGQNADRWRDGEPFLNTGELKSTWAAFFGARPLSALRGKAKADKKGPAKGLPTRKWLDICFPWNAGNSLKAPGDCKSTKGTVLRHVCNFVLDRNKPDVVCDKDHTRASFHK
jgi:hypothetical protein